MVRLIALAVLAGAPAFAQTPRGTPVISHHYAKVNGVTLHYAEAGRGEPIIFLHGFPEFWYAWKDQLAEFGRDHRAIAPDMRGYNLSDRPAAVEQYTIPILIEDIRQLAESLGVKKFTLVAHDWGGALAWVFALRYPEYVKKLVIINAPHPFVFRRELANNPAQQKASQYMLFFRSAQAESGLSANNYQGLVNGVLGSGLKSGAFTEADKAEYIKAWSQPGALTGGLNYYRAARVGPPTPDAPVPAALLPGPETQITVPTLVIWGEKDEALLTGNLEGLDAYVTHLTVKRIPEGSHWVVHEQGPLVNRLIREFVTSP
ncbi:MAG: alpha/beta hydrolase [Gemmatimonadota bacterium]